MFKGHNHPSEFLSAQSLPSLYGCTRRAAGSRPSFSLFCWPFCFTVKWRYFFPHQTDTTKTLNWEFKAKVCPQQYPWLMTPWQRVLLENNLFAVWLLLEPPITLSQWQFEDGCSRQQNKGTSILQLTKLAGEISLMTAYPRLPMYCLPVSYRSIFHRDTEVLMKGWLQHLLRSNHLAYKCAFSSITSR